jgi:hypothetical protein
MSKITKNKKKIEENKWLLSSFVFINFAIFFKNNTQLKIYFTCSFLFGLLIIVSCYVLFQFYACYLSY